MSSDSSDEAGPESPRIQARRQQLASPPIEAHIPAHRNISSKTTTSTTVGTHQEDPKVLKPGEKHLTVEFVGPITITFNKRAERMRARKSILPKILYRTAYEGSATLSQFVTPDCLVKHRDVPDLKLQEGNAFQNVGDFIMSRDMTRLRIERQFKTQMKVEPSGLISLFDSYPPAEKRAGTQYNQSRLVGHRVYIAEIKTKGLIPATVRGEQQEVESIFVDGSLTTVSTSVDTFRKRIPVWIRKSAKPANGSSITVQQFIDSGADMYMSVPELRISDLVVRASPSRDHEWLSCGPIPMTAIGRIMPYDGRVVHDKKGNSIVQSRQSIETYVFDWCKRMWRHNPPMDNISHFRNELLGDKRKARDEASIDKVLSIVKGHLMRSREDDPPEDGSASPASEV